MQVNDLQLHLKCYSFAGGFTNFACKNQLPDFSMSGISVANELKISFIVYLH